MTRSRRIKSHEQIRPPERTVAEMDQELGGLIRTLIARHPGITEEDIDRQVQASSEGAQLVRALSLASPVAPSVVVSLACTRVARTFVAASTWAPKCTRGRRRCRCLGPSLPEPVLVDPPVALGRMCGSDRGRLGT
jgi:hypothetical protein